MKICIRAGKFRLSLPVPLGIALRLAAKRGMPGIGAGGIKELGRAVRRAKKVWGRLTLIEVFSADGTHIKIIL